ncbi:MAG: hypothetical protein PHE84_02990 [bacterium]|nr:hypothetical protein [bacterium]
MTIKTLLILLSLISYPSVSGAEYQHLQKYNLIQEQHQIAQNTEVLFEKPKQESYPSHVSAFIIKPTKSLKPVSPRIAFSLASIPLVTTSAVFAVETAVGWHNWENIRMPGIAIVYGLFSFTFLTIPSHIYVHDSLKKTSIVISAKVVSLAMSILGMMIVANNQLICDWGDSSSNDCDSKDESIGKLMVFFGTVGYVGTNIYELIDAPFAAKRYNEKIKEQQQGFFVLPYAYKDQYRINVGYHF